MMDWEVKKAIQDRFDLDRRYRYSGKGKLKNIPMTSISTRNVVHAPNDPAVDQDRLDISSRTVATVADQVAPEIVDAGQRSVSMSGNVATPAGQPVVYEYPWVRYAGLTANTLINARMSVSHARVTIPPGTTMQTAGAGIDPLNCFATLDIQLVKPLRSAQIVIKFDTGPRASGIFTVKVDNIPVMQVDVGIIQGNIIGMNFPTRRIQNIKIEYDGSTPVLDHIIKEIIVPGMEDPA